MRELNLDVKYAEPLMKYNALMDEQYANLKNGINKIIDSKIKRLKLNKNYQFDGVDKLKNLKDVLTKELMPRYEQGYFPHYVRDLNATFMQGLMPLLQKLDSASESLLIRKNNTLSESVDEIKGWVSNHAKSRSMKDNPNYTRNFFDVVKGYIDDINQFNTTAFLEDAFMDARLTVMNMYKSGESGPTQYMNNVTDFILFCIPIL